MGRTQNTKHSDDFLLFQTEHGLQISPPLAVIFLISENNTWMWFWESTVRTEKRQSRSSNNVNKLSTLSTLLELSCPSHMPKQRRRSRRHLTRSVEFSCLTMVSCGRASLKVVAVTVGGGGGGVTVSSGSPTMGSQTELRRAQSPDQTNFL